jgi:hypothetical protein
MALLSGAHSVDVDDVDGGLAELARRLRAHRGDKAAENLLWQRIDALLDERLRISDSGDIAETRKTPGA